MIALTAVGSTLAAVGFFTAEYGMSHPIGEHIPDTKDKLREEGAQGEVVKAGKEPPEKAVEDVSFETKGGDKGFKVVNVGETTARSK